MIKKGLYIMNLISTVVINKARDIDLIERNINDNLINYLNNRGELS